MKPTMTYRASVIAEELIDETLEFLRIKDPGCNPPSDEIEALAKAVARHLASLEAVLRQRTEHLA